MSDFGGIQWTLDLYSQRSECPSHWIGWKDLVVRLVPNPPALHVELCHPLRV